MKVLFIIISALFFSGCLLSMPRGQESRKFQHEISDLDSLEMLLLNEQETLYGESKLSQGDGIRLGMEKNKVRRAMGLPSQVEVAGNPKYENERWIYERSIPTLDGSYKETKVIYFEAGRLVGWESR